MTNAELGDQCVDRADLDARSAALVSKLRRGDVILAIGLKQRKCGESLDYLRGRFRSGKALQQFLKNEPRCHHDIGAQQRFFQNFNLRLKRRGVAANGE